MTLRKILPVLLLLLPFLSPAAQSPDLDAARGVIERLLPRQAAQFDLAPIDAAGGPERFRISADRRRIKVEGSTTSALLFGVDWYLKYVAKVQVSPDGDDVPARRFPLPRRPIEGETPYPYRYALNENVDGYSAPYWNWERWQREIDVLALSGVNAVLIERGTGSVLYRTFRDFGYGDAEIRGWIALPAHQNWQLMGNICCFDGPISPDLLEKRAASAKRIIARLRELGITPVLPGFYGIVPADFAKRFPGAHVVPQGEWAGFSRPGWLDPRDPMFARLAQSFYSHQQALFGDSDIYDMEVFQEGGRSGGVPVPEAARDVQQALERAHPGARWMMLAWQGNPRPKLLTGVARDRLLVVDIDHQRVPRDDRAADFQNAPFLFGGLWEFGGRTTLGANIANITARLQRVGRANRNMAGTALFTEGLDTNPFAYDLFTEMAWRSEPVDLARWTDDYVRRRYGAADPHALAAWRALRRTVYDIRIGRAVYNSERDGAADSLFDAQPGLTVRNAANWAPEELRYDDRLFRQALPDLLQVAPKLRQSETYRYDLVDVGRQCAANEARILLPEIKLAFEARDRRQFEALTRRWLALMDLDDRLLATDRFFRVGTWLSYVHRWASTPEEERRLDHDARSILTTWGDRKASEEGPLHDYGNRDWAGLTRDYYRPRWAAYFRSLDEEIRTGAPAKPIDWYAMGETWNRGTQAYSPEPKGDTYAAAKAVADFLGLETP